MSRKRGTVRFAIAMLLFLFQIALVIMMSVFLQRFSGYVYYAMEILSLIVILGLINDTRSPSYKIAWIILILILPVTGFIFYHSWGRTDLNKKAYTKVQGCIAHGQNFVKQDERVRKSIKKQYPHRNKISLYLENEGFPVFDRTGMKYYRMGEDLFCDIIKDLKEAKRFILIEFFIVAEGRLWDEIHEIIKEKALNGVEVKLIIDDFGSALRVHNSFIHELKKEGIEVLVFNNMLQYISKLYANHRNHQKIVVIDGNIGYTGGANLADEYVNYTTRFGIWKDSGIRLEGDGVWQLTAIFLEMWDVTTSNRIDDYLKYAPEKSIESTGFCQPFSDGPSNNPKNPAENLFKQIICGANEYLYIMTPYLVLESDIIELIQNCARSNVDVKIITPGIADKKLVNILTKYYYGRLLKSGVRIYEYTPGFIHSKSLICEDNGVIGTINLDFRSLYLPYECGVWVCGNEVIQDAKQDFLDTLVECREVTFSDWKNRSPWMKVIQPVLSLFGTLM